MAALRGAANSPVGTSTTRSTTALNKLGVKFYDADGNEFMYIKAEGAIAAYAPCELDIVSNAPLTEVISSSSALGFIGVAQAAFADEEYGFIQTSGKALALIPSGTTLGATLTAGSGALSATLTNAVKFATVLEAPVLLSGTTQAKYVWIHG
jgi:hypothetical protein